MLWLQLVVLPAEMGQLAVGIGRALGDLAVWLATDALPYIAAGIVALVLLRTLFNSLYLRAGPQRVRAWLAALFYVAFVYSTIPYMPQAWSLLRGVYGGSDTSCRHRCRGAFFHSHCRLHLAHARALHAVSLCTPGGLGRRICLSAERLCSIPCRAAPFGRVRLYGLYVFAGAQDRSTHGLGLRLGLGNNGFSGHR